MTSPLRVITRPPRVGTSRVARVHRPQSKWPSRRRARRALRWRWRRQLRRHDDDKSAWPTLARPRGAPASVRRAKPDGAVDAHGLSPDRRTGLLVAAMTLDEKMQQLVGAPARSRDPEVLRCAPRAAGSLRLRHPDAPHHERPRRRRAERLRAGRKRRPPARACCSHVVREGDRAPLGDGGGRVVRPRGGGAFGDVIGDESRNLALHVSRGRASTSRACRRAGATSSTSARIRSSPGRWPSPRSARCRRNGVIAMAKHFVANEQETEPHDDDVNVDDACCTSSTCCRSRWRCKERRRGVGDVLVQRGQRPYCVRERASPHRHPARPVGFKGYVQSDFFAVQSTAPTLRAGMDHEMPGLALRPLTPGTRRSGSVLRSRSARSRRPNLDTALARRYRQMFRLGSSTGR